MYNNVRLTSSVTVHYKYHTYKLLAKKNNNMFLLCSVKNYRDRKKISINKAVIHFCTVTLVLQYYCENTSLTD